MEGHERQVLDVRSLKPVRKLVTWAIDLTVENLKAYVSLGCLRFSKSKSLRNPKTKFIFVFLRSEAVGFCAFRIEAHTAFIYEIHVHAKHRSANAGSQMLESCKRNMPQDVRRIVLQVHKNNSGAVRFYERNGFKHDPTAFPSPNYHVMAFTVGSHEP